MSYGPADDAHLEDTSQPPCDYVEERERAYADATITITDRMQHLLDVAHVTQTAFKWAYTSSMRSEDFVPEDNEELASIIATLESWLGAGKKEKEDG